MSITYFQANKVLDRNFGSVSYTPSATLYIGLSTTPINADGTGATEPVGNGYTRASVANNKTSFSSAVNAVLTNLISIQFPESTASWGTITHIFISDSLSGGNILYFDAISPTRQVQANTTVLFDPSAITISMTN